MDVYTILHALVSVLLLGGAVVVWVRWVEPAQEKTVRTWPERVAAMTESELMAEIHRGNRETLVMREVMVRLLQDRLLTQEAARAAKEGASAATLASENAIKAADAADWVACRVGRLLTPPPRPGLGTRLWRALRPADLEIHQDEIRITAGSDR